ncbi:MAG: nuclear transport factor 2 family protein [Gammaproteobacteria bacterium]|nr:nuclear transport factor 2 family protein [Gammaproteobacteria bacterium]
MDRQERAMIQLECQQLLNRATQLLDGGQWQALADCYTEDAVLFRPSDAEHGITGRDAIYQSFCARPPRSSCHIIANSVFDIITANNVVATSRVWLATGSASETLPVTAESNLMIGSFTDTLIRREDQWLIQSRKGSIELKYCGQSAG